VAEIAQRVGTGSAEVNSLLRSGLLAMREALEHTLRREPV
jgi:DNA-directed RNA polymerase specialized sigma24 family protein